MLFRNLQGWADQLYRYLIAEAPVTGRANPTPVLLAHRTGGIDERAATDGVLLYDPTIKTVVVSEDGVWRPIAMESGLWLAELEIAKKYGDQVSIAQTARSNQKFGRNTDLSSSVPETIWEHGGFENYPAVGTNPIDEVVSDNAADTSQITVWTFTDDGSGNLTRLQQTVTLNGTTPVTLTACARAERIDLVDGEAALVGNIEVRESATPANVHVSVTAGNQRSYKCAMSTASNEYFIVTAVEAGVAKRQSAAVDFTLEERVLGSPFRPSTGRLFRQTNGTTDDRETYNSTPLLIRPNSDLRVIGESDSNTTGATAIIFGHYAEIVG